MADADSFLGLNFRMHELTGAVAGAQLRKLPSILARLRESRARLKAAIGPVPRARVRRCHDEEGDCATVLAYTFETAALAGAVAEGLGTITLAASGKHNYANIPQLARRAMPFDSCPQGGDARPLRGTYEPGTLPRTEDLLARTVALSVGVVDSYLGTGFGINVRSGEDEIERAAERFARVAGAAAGALP